VTIRFLADEDLHAGIIEGLRAREPVIDILDAKTPGLRGRKDPVLLDLAFRQNRILITHDRNTMTRFCKERTAAGKSNPGIIIVPQMSGIGEIIEEVLLLWTASHTEEWRNQIVYLPFR
jgi:predicted nuclease of predicted toxin-antitoxin system